MKLGEIFYLFSRSKPSELEAPYRQLGLSSFYVNRYGCAIAYDTSKTWTLYDSSANSVYSCASLEILKERFNLKTEDSLAQ